MTINSDIASLFGTWLNVDLTSVDYDTPLGHYGLDDSLDETDLILSIEAAFHVTMPSISSEWHGVCNKPLSQLTINNLAHDVALLRDQQQP